MKSEREESTNGGLGLIIFAATAAWLLLFHSGLFN